MNEWQIQFLALWNILLVSFKIKVSNTNKGTLLYSWPSLIYNMRLNDAATSCELHLHQYPAIMVELQILSILLSCSNPGFVPTNPPWETIYLAYCVICSNSIYTPQNIWCCKIDIYALHYLQIVINVKWLSEIMVFHKPLNDKSRQNMEIVDSF